MVHMSHQISAMNKKDVQWSLEKKGLKSFSSLILSAKPYMAVFPRPLVKELLCEGQWESKVTTLNKLPGKLNCCLFVHARTYACMHAYALRDSSPAALFTLEAQRRHNSGGINIR